MSVLGCSDTMPMPFARHLIEILETSFAVQAVQNLISLPNPPFFKTAVTIASLLASSLTGSSIVLRSSWPALSATRSWASGSGSSARLFFVLFDPSASFDALTFFEFDVSFDCFTG